MKKRERHDIQRTVKEKDAAVRAEKSDQLPEDQAHDAEAERPQTPHRAVGERAAAIDRLHREGVKKTRKRRLEDRPQRQKHQKQRHPRHGDRAEQPDAKIHDARRGKACHHHAARRTDPVGNAAADGRGQDAEQIDDRHRRADLRAGKPALGQIRRDEARRRRAEIVSDHDPRKQPMPPGIGMHGVSQIHQRRKRPAILFQSDRPFARNYRVLLYHPCTAFGNLYAVSFVFNLCFQTKGLTKVCRTFKIVYEVLLNETASCGGGNTCRSMPRKESAWKVNIFPQRRSPMTASAE